MVNWSPVEAFRHMGSMLFTPFGGILLVILAVYIYLRVTGRIEGVGILFNRGGGRGGSGNEQARKPDYIIK